MGAWRRLACYPQSTFYPFSDGSSMRNHRITISNFRSCSTCLSYSQAPLCYYTLHTITIRIEGTFEILRYILGGDRPSQTTRLTLSPNIFRLNNTYIKGGISLLTPSLPKQQYQTSPTYSTQNIHTVNIKL